MRAGIDVYSSRGTFEALGATRSRRAKIVPCYVGITNKTFDSYAFPIIHDAKEPFGYIVRDVSTNEYLFFAPDAGFIKQRFALKFSIIAIECSFDIKILQHRVDTQDINEGLAKRLLNSHMEKRVTLNYLTEFCDLSRCREIHLLHLSRGNIDAEKTCKEVEDKLFIETIIK